MKIIFKSNLSLFSLVLSLGFIFLAFSGISYGVSPDGEEVSALRKKVNAVWESIENKTELPQPIVEPSLHQKVDALWEQMD